MKIAELRRLDVGDEVRWDDPDDAIASGVYSIEKIQTQSGRIEDWDSIVLLASSNTDSIAEVFASEIA